MKPDCILAWGIRLYNNLPQRGKQGEDLDVEVEDEEYSFETWIYQTEDGKNIPVIGITHPSSAFDWEFWNYVLTQFVKNAYE